MGEGVRKALSLLDSRSRRILLALVLIQVAIAGLDLLGVLLLGVVAALSASTVAGDQSATLDRVTQVLGVQGVSDVYLALVLATVAAVILLLKSILSFLLIRRSLRFLANRQAMISSSLAQVLLSRPLLQVQRQPSQQRAYALTAAANAATIGILGNAVIVAAEAAVLIVLTVGLLVIDPVVAVFTVALFSVLGIFMNRVLGGIASRIGAQISGAEIESLASIQNALHTYREISVSGRRVLFSDRFQELRWRAARFQADNQVMTQVSKYVFEVGLILGACILAAWQLMTREVVAAVAVLAVFLAAASRVMPSLVRMQHGVLGIRTSIGLAQPIFELRQELSLSPQLTNQEVNSRDHILSCVDSEHEGFEPVIILTSVSVTYPRVNQPAVEDISVTVYPGGSLAVVGPTGAGKSTITDLILGVLEPDRGYVTLAGVKPAHAIAQWPGAIAYVPQEIVVIDGTIRSNVALGLPEELIDDELAWRALERARLSESLQAEREGLDTLVGEHGVKLSGGQRQRLGIARALYTRPRLLVLDEATSALDSETERAVGQALEELEGQVTLIIVAHRLATIRNCDQVAYLEGGHLVALGTFNEVRMKVPRFNLQAQLSGL